jgi:hypothetical protein
MAQYSWLSDTNNQQIVYELTNRTIGTLRPEELPYLEGIFPNYIELAQEGDIVVDKRRQPFAFDDPGGFFTQWTIAVVIEFLNQFLVKVGPVILAILSGKPIPKGFVVDPGTVRAHVRLALDETGLPADHRVEVEDCIVNAFLAMMHR